MRDYPGYGTGTDNRQREKAGSRETRWEAMGIIKDLGNIAFDPSVRGGCR